MTQNNDRLATLIANGQMLAETGWALGPTPETPGTYIVDSYFHGRIGDDTRPAFDGEGRDDGSMIVRLNGFAIIPREDFVELCRRAALSPETDR